MSNQDYRQDYSANQQRGQHTRDDWNDDRNWQDARDQGPYQRRSNYGARRQQGQNSRQNWDQGNFGQQGYRQDDYDRDNDWQGQYRQGNGGQANYGPEFRTGRDERDWGRDRGRYNPDYGSNRDPYDAGYAQGGQGGYSQGGGHRQGNFGGGFDQGQDQSGWNQGGSSWTRNNDSMHGGQSHRGRGPKNYQRSDDRICDDVCDRLSDDHDVDASDIDVSVSNREVTLSGEVDSKQAKRRAEDCADSCSGVEHVQNNLRVKSQSGQGDREAGKSKSK